MNYQHIIDKYYNEDADLRRILVVHSQSVARRALRIADKHPELHLDRPFIEEAAMLHDIGIIGTHAPSIHCTGNEPYIKHGILGRAMLDGCGLPAHALVCERHTGAGITVDDIVSQSLPLPHRDMCPVTIEEQLVCYADKFFSKTRPGAPARSLAEARGKLLNFGDDSLKRFDTMAARFGDPALVPPLAHEAR